MWLKQPIRTKMAGIIVTPAILSIYRLLYLRPLPQVGDHLLATCGRIHLTLVHTPVLTSEHRSRTQQYNQTQSYYLFHKLLFIHDAAWTYILSFDTRQVIPQIFSCIICHLIQSLNNFRRETQYIISLPRISS